MTFIDPGSKVLRHIDRVVAWRDGDTPAPVTIEWDLSNRCVLGCQDCHFAHTHTRGPWAKTSRASSPLRLVPQNFDSPGDLADADLVRRVLAECTDAGVKSVIWTGGGEPTTHPQWQDILRAADANGIEQGMYTLGGLFTRKSAARAASILKWVVVSLDCIDRDTYAAEKGVRQDRFDAAVHGIRWLSEAGSATVGVSFLIHEGNWKSLWDMLEMARFLGATYTTFRPAIQTSPSEPSAVIGERAWITQALPLLEDVATERDVEMDPARFVEYRDWKDHGYETCLGIRMNTTITPDGRVWICPQRRGMTAIGDLRKESFRQVWARHPREFSVDSGCRVHCRLHALNKTLDRLEQPLHHENFM